MQHLQAATTDSRGHLVGTDYWHDDASFTHAGIPTAVFGSGAVRLGHTVDEHLPMTELLTATQVLAVTAMRFCGTHLTWEPLLASVSTGLSKRPSTRGVLSRPCLAGGLAIGAAVVAAELRRGRGGKASGRPLRGEDRPN